MSMKNVGDLMKRLQKMMPAHIEPAFKTDEELLAWQKEQGRSCVPKRWSERIAR